MYGSSSSMGKSRYVLVPSMAGLAGAFSGADQSTCKPHEHAAQLNENLVLRGCSCTSEMLPWSALPPAQSSHLQRLLLSIPQGQVLAVLQARVEFLPHFSILVPANNMAQNTRLNIRQSSSSTAHQPAPHWIAHT